MIGVGAVTVTGWAPADWLIAISVVVGAVAVVWTKAVGPFIARPIGKAIRNELDDVVAERLAPVEHAQDLAAQALVTIDALVRSNAHRMSDVERRLGAVEGRR